MKNETDRKEKIRQKFEEIKEQYIQAGLAAGFTIEELRENIKKDLNEVAEQFRKDKVIH